MNKPAEQKSRPNRLAWIMVGGFLFVLGLPSWYLLSSVLVALAPSADWPKELAVVGIAIPLLIVVGWQFRSGRKNEIGYVVFGCFVVGFVLEKLLFFVLSSAPHG